MTPEPWVIEETKDGVIQYRNKDTGEINLDHPLDAVYRRKYQAAKKLLSNQPEFKVEESTPIIEKAEDDSFDDSFERASASGSETENNFFANPIKPAGLPVVQKMATEEPPKCNKLGEIKPDEDKQAKINDFLKLVSEQKKDLPEETKTEPILELGNQNSLLSAQKPNEAWLHPESMKSAV